MKHLNAIYLVLLHLWISPLCASTTADIAITEGVKKSIKERIANKESVGVVVGIINSKGERDYYSLGTTTMGGPLPVD